VIVGDIKVNDYVAIGANSFVNSNVDKNSTIGGSPARVLNNVGSYGLVNNAWKESQV
jgi:serine acetyltransferase